jgi:hypothetical protein
MFGGYFLIYKGIKVENYSLQMKDQSMRSFGYSSLFGYISFIFTKITHIIVDHLTTD